MLTRQKELLQWLAGGLTTSAVIAGSVWLTDHRQAVIAQVFGGGSSTMASTASSEASSVPAASPTKSDVLQGHAEASLQSEQKASGNMQITLSSTDGRKADGSLAMQAYVTAIADLNDLKYEWILPDGAVVSTGALNGSFGNVAEGTQVSSAVTVVVPSANAHVVFHAYREMAGEKVGQVAQYNTVDQSTIDMQLALKRDSLQRKPASMTDRRFE